MTIEQINDIMKSAKSVFFIGAGGVSMSSLAVCTAKRGYKAGGSDRDCSPVTERLEDDGVTMFYGHKAENIAGYDVIVYTAAIKNDNPELCAAKNSNLPCFTRAEYLGWLMSGYKNRIGIAGTHGKSTVTSMTGKIFADAGLDPTIMVGAQMRDMDSSYRIGERDYFIFEACEYTDSFLSFCPTTAVVTNIEYDHADYFKDMNQLEHSFESYMELADTTVAYIDDSNVRLALGDTGVKAVTFGIDNDDADFRAVNITYDCRGCAGFDIVHGGDTLCHIQLGVPGRHNVIDALAAFTSAYISGVGADEIAKSLLTFSGAKRRFEYKGTTPEGAAVYDDYSHHPSEIEAAIDAAKKLGKRIVCVFQPHTYSRTISLLDGFVSALGTADEAVLADIYAARETNPGGISSKIIADRLKNGRYIPNFEDIVSYIRKTCSENDLILVTGAGSITQVADMLVSAK